MAVRSDRGRVYGTCRAASFSLTYVYVWTLLLLSFGHNPSWGLRTTRPAISIELTVGPIPEDDGRYLRCLHCVRVPRLVLLLRSFPSTWFTLRRDLRVPWRRLDLRRRSFFGFISCDHGVRDIRTGTVTPSRGSHWTRRLPKAMNFTRRTTRRGDDRDGSRW